MRPSLPSYLAALSLLSSPSLAKDYKDAEGIVEIDIAFPKNETYGQLPFFPVIVAFQNPSLTPFLKTAALELQIWNTSLSAGPRLDEMRERSQTFDLSWANFTTDLKGADEDLHFEFKIFDTLQEEGTYQLDWTLAWETCWDEGSPSGNLVVNVTRWQGPPVVFTIEKGGKTLNETMESSINSCNKDYNPLRPKANETDPALLALRIEKTFESGKKEFEATDGYCPLLWKNVAGNFGQEMKPCKVQVNASQAEELTEKATESVCRRDSHFVPEGMDCEEREAKEDTAGSVVVGGVVMAAMGIGAAILAL